eukprot:6182746-Pleurochrysis_carterae.AAC.3
MDTRAHAHARMRTHARARMRTHAHAPRACTRAHAHTQTRARGYASTPTHDSSSQQHRGSDRVRVCCPESKDN